VLPELRKGLSLLRVPDLADRDVDAGLDVNEDVFTPQPFRDISSGHHASASLDEQDEQFHRLTLELYGSALPAELIGLDVQLEVPKAECLAGGRLHHRAG
jgi:hypothetical protein